MAPKKEKEEQTPLEKLVLSLADSVKTLSKEVKSMKLATAQLNIPQPAVEKGELNIREAPKQTTPIPSEYRAEVDKVLNQDFRVEINPISDRPAFEFVIIVPDKYSSISEAYKQTYKEDRRPVVIPYSEGLLTVKTWVEKVSNNLGPDVRNKIALDRTAGGI